ncbi:PLP-dependent transferase [Aureobasidium subglaciale]|nr:PLP-dependent transferase [Aureobasidium subglaciale]KAI5227294.1 PLP-dependent transferase [Aureobasidium subglaciale]KAI5230617.1 PLP-dependent transferase [Aureobasidium subglaciale]KAI5264863.1 PLP-dependent transferase [Aureobasidium subglaciale]
MSSYKIAVGRTTRFGGVHSVPHRLSTYAALSQTPYSPLSTASRTTSMGSQGLMSSLPIPAWLQGQSTRTFSTTPRQRRLTIENINQNVVEAEYAVRGELAVKSEKYREQLRKGDSSLPFDTIISANIGNPQQLDQKPITFFRQVLSLMENPLLLEHPDVLTKTLGYKQDSIDRAKKLLDDVKSVGAYSASKGAPGIRQSVANFIEKRDGYPADPESIFLSAGASGGVSTMMNVMCADANSGVLVPIPQYPLYTATLALLNAKCVPYELEEEKAWGTNLDAIRASYAKAKAEGTSVRSIVIINPGNPTGASLTVDDIKSVIKFAAEEKLVVVADEVYQTNVFVGKFTSFKQCLRELQQSDENKDGRFDTLELVSLHSISKGMIGECGHRGGYFELPLIDFHANLLNQVTEQIYKYVSIQLCPPVIGQCLVSLMVEPPVEGDPSYDIYHKEERGIFDGLQKRATALYEAFREMEGVSCQSPTGSMYLFPTITLPPKAIEKAKQEGRKPDEYYCMRLLDATGVCVVAGSGFGQKEGTLHFRTTFLAPGTEWVGRITKFHKEFMAEFK